MYERSLSSGLDNTPNYQRAYSGAGPRQKVDPDQSCQNQNEKKPSTTLQDSNGNAVTTPVTIKSRQRAFFAESI
jgi:hypothetical protein